MRIKILIEASVLPIIYRHRVISFFKEALKISDIDYKEFLYGEKITKPFAFSVVKPFNSDTETGEIVIDENFKIRDKIFILKDKFFSLYISSSDYRFIISLFNGISSMKVFNFSSDREMLINGEKLSWKVKRVYPLKDKKVIKNEVIFKTNSPISLEDKRGKPILFNSPHYEEELNYVMNVRLKAIRGYGLLDSLRFSPIKMRKKVVKHTLKEFRERTGKPLMYLTCSEGVFKLVGNPLDLEFISKVGLGCRTGQGFGMVEVIG